MVEIRRLTRLAIGIRLTFNEVSMLKSRKQPLLADFSANYFNIQNKETACNIITGINGDHSCKLRS